MNATPRGLYDKFTVTRNDGRDQDGDKHNQCEYFVLDLTHDKHAMPAITAYADSCAGEFPELAEDLYSKVHKAMGITNDFVNVPETTLPNGLVVPAFKVGQFHCAQGDDGKAVIDSSRAPWVNINYAEAVTACEAIEAKLITETQSLALAWNIYNVAENWSGGAIGEGALLMGLHDDDDLDEAPTGFYIHPDQRRGFTLSNGETIFDAAGCVFSWVFDDVQGDERGLVAQPFAEASPSITTPPHPSMEKGMGWRPNAGANWSGFALVRGGYWSSGPLPACSSSASTGPAAAATLSGSAAPSNSGLWRLVAGRCECGGQPS